MQQINLLNPQLLAPRVRFSSRSFVALLGGALALGGLAIGWVDHTSGAARAALQAAQEERDAAQAALDALQQAATANAANEQLAALNARHAHLLELRAALGGGPDAAGFSPQLRALAVQGLPGIWLTGIEFRRDGFRLDGRALDPARLPDYLALLSARPALHGLPFTGLSMAAPTDAAAAGTGVAFTVNPASGAP